MQPHLRFGHGPSPQPFARGDLLAVPSGASFPPLCVKCGAAAVHALPITYDWTPHYRLTVGALMDLKIVTLSIPLCAEHLARHRRLASLWIAFGAASALCIVLCVATSNLREITWLSPTLGLASVPLLVLAYASHALLGKLLRPTAIEGSAMVFRGAGRGFLSRLPQG